MTQLDLFFKLSKEIISIVKYKNNERKYDLTKIISTQ